MMAGLFGPIENSRYAGYVRDIHRSGHHLLAIINDILDLSKIEAGGFQVTEGIVDLSGVLAEVVGLMRPRATDTGVALTLDLPPGLPLLLADARAIKQIALNLVSNAVKFTPAGGRVEVAVRPASGGLSLLVRDTGIGMAQEDIAKALEPFVQLEGPLSRRYQGTGLGLPIVKALIDLHGGQLHMASRLGEGTTVTVRLPPARVLRSGGPASAVLEPPRQPLISRAASTAP
jgi:signal transduction histidine kinase